MGRVDRGVGAALLVLAIAVGVSARSFPNVPGQKLGAGFLPMIVGAGLALCGLALWRRGARAPATPREPGAPERAAPALAVMAGIALYVLVADRLGFLLVAPAALVLVLRAMQVSWRAAVLWALAGTVVVHVAFYKLLRVPLPWGVLRPFY